MIHIFDELILNWLCCNGVRKCPVLGIMPIYGTPLTFNINQAAYTIGWYSVVRMCVHMDETNILNLFLPGSSSN